MTIQEILSGISALSISGPENLMVEGLCIDSRKLEPGDAFVCIQGTLFDSHSLAPELYEQGVRVFFCEKDLALAEDALIVQLPNMRSSLSLLAQNFYGHPAREMTMIGLTGSKGKTTVAHMIFSHLLALGAKPGLLGSNGAMTEQGPFAHENTTPEPLELQRVLRKMADMGCRYVLMEVSSQAMKYHRVDGMRFDLGVFLNIERTDHIGPLEHEDFADYLRCKKEFLTLCKEVLIWQEEPHLPELKEASAKVHTYGRSAMAQYLLQTSTPAIQSGYPGMDFTVGGRITGEYFVRSLGEIGALNALASLSVLHLLGFEPEGAKESLASLTISGRMDWITRSDDYSVLLDFAHNGMAAKAVLEALRLYSPRRLVCLFGGDGARDPIRRLDMGRAAGSLADLTILTERHSRLDSLEEILEGILEGMHEAGGEYIIIKDRVQAIQWAVENRQPGDVLVIFGVGPQEYMYKGGKKVPHSERELVLHFLEESEPAENF